MPKLMVLVASTRPGRIGSTIGAWFAEYAKAQGDFEVEFVELADFNLPVYDEPNHPIARQYEHAHTKRWSDAVAGVDAFAIIAPEYDYSPAPSLLNAQVYLFHEWNYKPIGYVSYGGVSGGLRGVQANKLTATTLRMFPVSEGVVLNNVFGQLDDSGVFQANEGNEKAADAMLAELRRVADALAVLRA